MKDFFKGMDQQYVEDLAREFWNCKVAELDEDFDLWIEDPIKGHWIGDNERTEFIRWILLYP